MKENPAECPRDPVLQEDLEIVAKDHKLAEALRGKRILVTGATGLVGSWLVRALACMNRIGHNGMEIYGVIRNEEKARTIYGDAFLARPDVHFVKADITADDFVETARTQISDDFSKDSADRIGLGNGKETGDHKDNGADRLKREESAGPDRLDIVIHGAAVTTSKTMVEKPVETIMTAILGTRNLLELAKDCGAEDFVYLSSMEMYGNLAAGTGAAEPSVAADKGQDVNDQDTEKAVRKSRCDDAAGRNQEDQTRATEDRLGWLDLTAVRSDYPESKRMCENLCIGYGHEHGIRVKIARLAQTFGAGILPWEGRVFAQFARSAMAGEDIVLHTKGLSEGNYCYTRDAVRGILTIAVSGAAGEVYNVANESTHTTIADMAEMVASKIAGGKIRVVYDIPAENTFGYAADTKLRLDASKLRALGWKPEVGLEEMYRRMMASMQAEGEQ